MINRTELKVDYYKVAGCNVTITHVPSGLVEYANETKASIDTAVERLEARLRAMDNDIDDAIHIEEPESPGVSRSKKITPYYGDPGDEQDVSRWEGEGGHW